MKNIKRSLIPLIVSLSVTIAVAADSAKSPVFQVRSVVGNGMGAPTSGKVEEMSRTNLTATGQTRRETVYVNKKVLLDQNDFKTTKVVIGQPSGEPQIAMTCSDHGRKRLAEVTRQNIGKQLAIIIGGRLYSAPWIRTELSSGELPVSGDFSRQEAENLSKRINEALRK